MKNKLGIFFLIISFFTVDATISYVKKEKNSVVVQEEIKEIRAIYISYLEYFDNFYGGSKSVNESKIDKMIDNIKMDGFNTIILHVSPFSDAIYSSKIFPYSYTLTGEEGKNPGFDYLEYFIKVGHAKNIQIHAWINPYRVSFDSTIKNISIHNPAYKLYNTSSLGINEKGIYYNPSSEIVKNLILRQVEEIINKYDVDGIHFDDYFYMQNDIDKLEYDAYIKNGGEMSLKEFRLYHTNDLVKRVYKTIKSKKSNVIFSISPDGNINNNYRYHYADVKTWLNSNEYVDIIMPQIYYGFNNQYSPFESVLNNWIKIRVNESIKIVPILAFYKIGFIDNDAGSGKNEWLNDENIINRQINSIRQNNLSGYGLFRYDYMYSKSKMCEKSVKEMENLKKNN